MAAPVPPVPAWCPGWAAVMCAGDPADRRDPRGDSFVLLCQSEEPAGDASCAAYCDPCAQNGEKDQCDHNVFERACRKPVEPSPGTLWVVRGFVGCQGLPWALRGARGSSRLGCLLCGRPPAIRLPPPSGSETTGEQLRCRCHRVAVTHIHLWRGRPSGRPRLFGPPCRDQGFHR
jgi:hypothetical protein